MRYPASHLARTRACILDSARRLFTAHGYAGTSIEAVMRGCGLTRGGFYRHFPSKGALYAAALGAGAASAAARRSPTAWLDARLQSWLDERPLAALAADTASRSTDVRSAARRTWSDFLQRVADTLSSAWDVDDEPTLQAAVALVVGTLAQAQGLGDAPARRRVLAAGVHGLHRLLDAREAAEIEHCLWVPAALAARAAPAARGRQRRRALGCAAS